MNEWIIINEQLKLKSHIQGIYNQMDSIGIHNIEENKEFGQILLAIGKHNKKDIQLSLKDGVKVPTFQDIYVRMRIFRDDVLKQRISYLENYIENEIYEECDCEEEVLLMKRKIMSDIQYLDSKIYRG